MEQKITLKDLVKHQELSDYSDLEIIKMWFMFNNCEQEGISIITDLSKSKADKLEQQLAYARTWVPVLPNVYESNKGKIDLEQAKKLDLIIKLHLLGLELKGDILKWAQENIPKMITPNIIFKPAIDWLKDEYGIEFIK